MDNFFGRNIIPEEEVERLENLYNYRILDTRSDPRFNSLAGAAAVFFNVPVALINFVDSERVWTKANNKGEVGAEVPRGTSLCSLAILEDKITIFEDAPEDPCLALHPFVTGSFGLRFYAAAPITTKEGFNIGAVAIIDFVPRYFSDEKLKMLEQIADKVATILEE